MFPTNLSSLAGSAVAAATTLVIGSTLAGMVALPMTDLPSDPAAIYVEQPVIVIDAVAPTVAPSLAPRIIAILPVESAPTAAATAVDAPAAGSSDLTDVVLPPPPPAGDDEADDEDDGEDDERGEEAESGEDD